MDVGNWIRQLMREGSIKPFYESKEWRRLRQEVLKEYKYECQLCKKAGLYTKATHVHHVQFVQKHPDLALSKTYIYNGEERQNLLPVCRECHETRCHPERLRWNKKEPLTEERWD